MATSCIYFVLVLTILSLGNTSAAFQNNFNNNNNINNTNTSNNYNNNHNTIESATQHSAGILRYSESSASELSSTNYSKYQAEKERYRIHPDIDSETDSEASNTHKKNNKNKNNKEKEKANTNNAKQTDTERQHHHHPLGDTDIFGPYSLPDDPIYTNEFAVHIPAGKYVADGIADKYGFINRGQVIVICRKCQ